MTTNSTIDAFIKKYRKARASKSKEIRISIDEATSIIAAFAATNTSNTDMIKLLTSISKDVKKLSKTTNQSNNLDGGKF